MLKSIIILNTNRVNKYGHRLTLSAMEDMVWMRAVEGVPLHIGHDMHRLLGAMIPLGLYMESKMITSLGNTLIPESAKEEEYITNFKHNFHYKRVQDAVDQNENKLFEQVKNHIYSDFKYVNTGSLSILNEGIVKRIFEELIALQDKAGLIKLDDLYKNFTYKKQGVFFHKTLPLCIYAHSYFRRSLSRHNTFHFLFLDELVSMQSNEDITIKISLDWNLIGYSPTFLETVEYEYWFGPKYTDEISNIQKGLTKHSCSNYERDYYGISTTEFFWKDNSELKEFELEELRENDAPTMKDFFGCRYMHSIYDTLKKTFVHFDGAIRGYDSDLYFERLDQSMTDFGRRSQYTKLFRIDGKLALNEWKSLVTNYMQGNPLIYEYFGVGKPRAQLREVGNSKLSRQKLVPHSMDKDDGIKILVSYHNKNESFESVSHSVSIYDVVKIGEKRKSILEHDIIEVKKALNRLGKELNIKDNILYGICKDEYWNIPCIFHGKKYPQNDIQITFEALNSLFKRMIIRGLGTIVSFTLSWNIEDKEVRISCLGHIENLSEWIEHIDMIPVDRKGLKNWLNIQRAYLDTTFKEHFNKPLIQDICQSDGILYLKRKAVGEEFNLELFQDEEALNYKFSIPSNKQEKYEEVVSGTVKPVPSFFVKKSICSVTEKEYYKSPYSKILDNNVHMVVTESQLMSFYWSDKPLL